MIDTIICDMDGTLVDYPNEPFHSSWDALAEALPEKIKQKWFEIRDFYYLKKGLSQEWYKKQVFLLKGLDLEKVSEYLFPIPYSEGVREFFSNDNSYIKGIISSGVNLVADRIAYELGFDFVKSDFVEIKDGKFTGEGEPKMNLWRKDLDLLKIVKEKNLNLEKVLYIGDNENDIPVFRIVGIPVAFKPKNKETERVVKYIIEDFRELEGILEKLI